MQVLNPNPFVPQDQQFIPKQDEIIRQCQWYAIDQWLSSYPDSATYDEIINFLKNDEWDNPDTDYLDMEGEYEIVEWYLIEGHSGDQIAKFIEDTFNATLRLVQGLINGQD